MITTELVHKRFDLEIGHENEPLWDCTDEGYVLPRVCDYGIKSVRLTGKKTKEVKLTPAILAICNELVEDEYSPQFMR